MILNQKRIIINDDNIIIKNIDDRYNEIYIYRLVKGIDFGIEVNIFYK
jgi:hypothetical protein